MKTIALVVIAAGAFFGALVAVDALAPASIASLQTAMPVEAALEPVLEDIFLNAGACAPDQLAAPEHVKALYMSSWVAGSPGIRKRLVQQVSETDLNALVIDIKDVSGHAFIPFESEAPAARGIYEASRMRDIGEFLQEICAAGIYPIARLVLFKDPLHASAFPERALQYENGRLWWGDGSHWVSPAASEYWQLMRDLSLAAGALGFREINLDYIRWPSRGNLDAAIAPDQGARTKAETITDVVRYFDTEVRSRGIAVSVDIFGMALSDVGDVGIGQHLEDFVPYVDAIAPMTYPSHYYPGFAGYAEPAKHPYSVMYASVHDGLERLAAIQADQAIMRPWIQGFTYVGVYYGTYEVAEQIRALSDLGLESWTLWDPQNTYHY